MDDFKQKLIEVFPSPGTTVTEAELKFRYGGIPEFEQKLQKLVDEGVLVKYQFGGSWHYKSKMSLRGASSPALSGGGNRSMEQKLNELIDIVKIIATKVNAPDLLDRLDDLQQ